MSGTPALARPIELFTSLACLMPNTFTNFHDFGARYCDAKEKFGHLDYKGASNLPELNLKLSKTDFKILQVFF